MLESSTSTHASVGPDVKVLLFVNTRGSIGLVDVLWLPRYADAVVATSAVYGDVDVVTLLNGPSGRLGEIIMDIVERKNTVSAVPLVLEDQHFPGDVSRKMRRLKLKAFVRVTLDSGASESKGTLFSELIDGRLSDFVIFAGIVRDRDEVVLMVGAPDSDAFHNLILRELQFRSSRFPVATRTYGIVGGREFFRARTIGKLRSHRPNPIDFVGSASRKNLRTERSDEGSASRRYFIAQQGKRVFEAKQQEVDALRDKDSRKAFRLFIDVPRQEVSSNGSNLTVRPQVYKALRYMLFERAGDLARRDALLEAIYADATFRRDPKAIISEIRRVFNLNPPDLLFRHGGYRFADDIQYCWIEEDPKTARH